MGTRNSFLESLPIETLQHIASFLPPQALLNFNLSSQKIRTACDQSLVWQRSVERYSGFLGHIEYKNEGLTWKQLAIVDAKSGNLEYTEELLSWLPQALAFHHRICPSLSSEQIHRLSDPLRYSLGTSMFDCEMPIIGAVPPQRFPTDATSPIDINGWRLAQAGSFCLAAHLLSYGSVGENESALEDWDPANTLLLAVPWTKIHQTDCQSQPAEYEKLAVILHTLANQVVGLLCARIRAHRQLVDWSSNNMPLPITQLDIPFQSLMDLPELFSSIDSKKFSLCHVRKMATPEFFEDGRWTGYDCMLLAGLNVVDDPIMLDLLDGIGRNNQTVEINRFYEHFILSPRTPSNFPFEGRVERHTRFKLVSWIDDRFFIVQSNCFHTSCNIQILRLKVDSWTGIVTILQHREVLMSFPLWGMSAVITPFGLIFGGGQPAKNWMWLWKLDWCSNQEE